VCSFSRSWDWLRGAHRERAAEAVPALLPLQLLLLWQPAALRLLLLLLLLLLRLRLPLKLLLLLLLGLLCLLRALLPLPLLCQQADEEGRHLHKRSLAVHLQHLYIGRRGARQAGRHQAGEETQRGKVGKASSHVG